MLNLELKINDGLEKYLVSKFEDNWHVDMLGRERPGIQYKFHFENGYGASVIKHGRSFGYENDLWELALLKKDCEGWYIEYREIVENDVLGYLTDEQVNRLLENIKDGKVDEYIEDL